MDSSQNLVGYSSTTLLDRTPPIPMPGDFILETERKKEEVRRVLEEAAKKTPPVEMYQAGTGAVRSSDLKKERWDLLSGAALDELHDAMDWVDPEDFSAEDLAGKAAEYMWRFLGFNTANTAGKDAHCDLVERIDLLTRGWAWLACAIEADEKIPFRKGLRYPLAAIRRTAMASEEGCRKYGEENWLNGFRVKILANHALRHLIRYHNGVVEDDELGHASWGFMAATHMVLYRPDMCDLLAGPEYTITDELKEYHKNHLSRRGL